MQYQHHPKNLGQNQLKTCSKYHLVGLLNEKQASTFAHFFILFQTPLTLKLEHMFQLIVGAENLDFRFEVA